MEKEHLCKERSMAELIQSGYQVEWTILTKDDNNYYLNVNKEFEIPIRGCPFCHKDFPYGEIKKVKKNDT